MLGEAFVDEEGSIELGSDFADEFEGGFVVIQDIGPEVELSVGGEASFDTAEHFFVEDAAFFVTGFPPGVGKVDVNGVDTFGREFVADGRHAISAEDASVGDVKFFEFGLGGGGVFLGEFDPDEEVIGELGCVGGEEETFTCANFDFDSRMLVEDFAERIADGRAKWLAGVDG